MPSCALHLTAGGTQMMPIDGTYHFNRHKSHDAQNKSTLLLLSLEWDGGGHAS